MAKALAFLRPCLSATYRPTPSKASAAHLRLYRLLHSKTSDTSTPELQWSGRQLSTSHAYPRVTSSSTATSCRNFRDRYQTLGREEVKEDEEVILRGRVYNHRSAGMKLLFIDLQQEGKPLQIVCNYAKLQGPPGEKDYHDFRHSIRKGDVYNFKGNPCRTSRGELSLQITEIPELLSPCLHPFPDTLSDQETKIRNRHLDFWTSKRSSETLQLRSDIIQQIRSFLLKRGHREVQTPILADEAGGAVARPFHTSATEFQQRQLSLRIAPELWLKRLVLGGFDKVFEIGPCFRNEGLDLSHNPEYTTCEFYEAYASLEDLITTTESLFQGLALSTRKLFADSYSTLPSVDIDFTPPFSRLDFIPALEAALKQPLPSFSSPTAASDLLSLFNALNHPTPTHPTLPRLLDRLSSLYLEPQCEAPTFITHHPECLSPLAKSFIHPTTNQRVAARAELFIKGQEMVNLYEEENSPFEQRRKFEEQLRYKDDGSGVSGKQGRPINESYLEALEWGLPPTGGWGCGIDRLCMLFSGATRIGDVLAFGNLRNVVSLGRRGKK